MPEYPTRLGRYETTAVAGEVVRAYVPVPLPPAPPVDLAGLQIALELANQTLGRLDGIASVLPDPSLFLYIYIRKEAVLSSQIEGTQSSLSDLLLFEIDEAPGVPLDDVAEVVELRRGHEPRPRRGCATAFRCRSACSGRSTASCWRRAAGSDKHPGEFRRSARTGSAARGPATRLFVPPPPHGCRTAWARWNDSCTTTAGAARCS